MINKPELENEELIKHYTHEAKRLTHEQLISWYALTARDMRLFQEKFINADQEINRLKGEVERLEIENRRALNVLADFSRITKIEQVKIPAGRLTTCLKYNIKDINDLPEPPFWLITTSHEFVNFTTWTKDLAEFIANSAQAALTNKQKG
jgi:hypothetical protein